MENCHLYNSVDYGNNNNDDDDDNNDNNITTTHRLTSGDPICFGQPLSFDFHNKTDHCEVSALCDAERTGFAIVIPAICCIGIILNTFNLIVLSTKNRFPESSYTYLTALAVADLLSLFFFAVNGIGRGYYPNSHGWRAFEVYAYFPLGSSSTTVSILTTVTVTIERYAFIYHPLKSKTWCSRTIARRVVVVLLVVSLVINSPRFFTMTVDEAGHLGFTEFGCGAFYFYFVWLYFSLISLASCLCLIVFNTLLIIGIQQTNRKRKSLIGKRAGSVKSQEEATLTRTLIMVVCVFVAGEFPSSFTSRSLVGALVGRGDHSVLHDIGYRIAVLISTGLVVTQHSLNFVVYCVFNRRFCAVLRHHYLPRLYGRRSNLDLHIAAQKEQDAKSDNEATSVNVVQSYV